VFLLTDDQPKMLAGGPGLSIERDERASDSLLTDLRSDVGMEWVTGSMWFTYLRLDAEARDLDYDLALSAHPSQLPTLRDAGVDAKQAQVLSADSGRVWWQIVAGVLAASATAIALGVAAGRKRERLGGFQ
jgi:hypothetical protein